MSPRKSYWRGIFFIASLFINASLALPGIFQLRAIDPSTSAQSGTLSTALPTNQTSPDADLAQFGQTVQVLGLMERTDQDFVDGLALDLFSPANRTVVVQRNFSPLPGNFVTGSNGEPFVALSNYSYVIAMNETANDLIAKVELPYDPVALQQVGVDPGNTYVGTLAADKRSWVVSESQRNVHVSENKTRIIKMTSLDGEYILLGRKTLDTSNIFVQYGQGATRTVNVTGNGGGQEAEFVDGLRFNIMSEQPFAMNVELINGIRPETLPFTTSSLNSFAWQVNTSMPIGTAMLAEMKVPFNRAMLNAIVPYTEGDEQRITVARRSAQASSEMFTPLAIRPQDILLNEDRIQISGLTSVDGQYIILVSKEFLDSS